MIVKCMGYEYSISYNHYVSFTKPDNKYCNAFANIPYRYIFE